MVTASKRCRSFAMRRVNHAIRREKRLRNQLASLNSWGTSEDFSSTYSIENPSDRTVLTGSMPRFGGLKFCRERSSTKAKESKRPRHLFVIYGSRPFPAVEAQVEYGRNGLLHDRQVYRTDAAI